MNKKMPIERFFDKIDFTGPCWEWQGAKYQNGYGCFRFMGKTYPAGRVIHYMLFLDYDPSKQLYRTCRNKACVNPDHMEQLTHREISQRVNIPRDKPWHYCKHGHELSDDNVYESSGRRRCRRCKLDSKKRRKEMKVADKQAGV